MVAERQPVDKLDQDPAVIVVPNGDRLPRGVAAGVPASAVVVAADGGARLARAAGLRVDHVVGDFDSLDRADRSIAARSGAQLHPYPDDKDFTDLELAIELAVSLASAQPPASSTEAVRRDDPDGPDRRTRVVVLGGDGGRVDHFLANVALLSSPRWATPARRVSIEGWIGTARLLIAVGGDRVSLGAPVGSLVSLLPQHGQAWGVTTEGLRYPLRGESLLPGSSRGVSNVVVDPAASVAVERGLLLIIQPTYFGPSSGTPEEPT